MRIPVDVTAPINRPIPRSAAEYAWRLAEDLRTTFNTARETLGRAYSTPKDFYGRHARPQNFRVGDLVWIYRPVPPPGIPKKFHHPWRIDVHRVLRVLSPTTHITKAMDQSTPSATVHHNNLKLYRGELPVIHNEALSILLEDELPPVGREKVVGLTDSTEDSAGTGRGAL